MAVALVALAFALAGSAVAAGRYLIQSTRQVNPAVIKSLTRAALQEQLVVKSAITEVPRGAAIAVFAKCPLGAHLLSGGYKFSGDSTLEHGLQPPGPPEGAYIEQDAPSLPAPEWVVVVNNAHGSHTVSVRAEALCVKPTGSP
jgi:hypothetical protein